MFDKNEMMDDEYGFYIRDMAKEVPITADRIDKYVGFISHYVYTRNKIIKKYEAEGKDTTHLIYERDNALYILGLGEKPESYWKNN